MSIAKSTGMVVLLLLCGCCLPNVWTHDVVSQRSGESAASSSRGYLYYHEALALKESNKTDAGRRIWGGDFISITQAPYAVLYGWTCGGSLISPNWVITAAHCDLEYYIHAGSEIPDFASEFPIAKHLHHPGWFGPKFHSLDFDCLLLQLATSVPVTDVSRPIAFGTYDDVNVGQLVTISGWGHATYEYNMLKDNSMMSDRLRAVRMTVINFNYCATQVRSQAGQYGEIYGIAEVTPRMICAEGNLGGATCFGDSGDPVVANDRLVGLVSWGVHCEPLLMFTNVIMLKKWISSVTGLIL